MIIFKIKQYFIFLFVFLLAAPLSLQAATVTWHSYDKGLALAKAQKKKVYINFYADWCMYCKKMDKETFVSSKVAAYLNEHFIAVRVHTDKETATANKYNVRGLPANFFLTDQGDVIGNQPGFLNPEMFIQLLSFVKEEKYKKSGK